MARAAWRIALVGVVVALGGAAGGQPPAGDWRVEQIGPLVPLPPTLPVRSGGEGRVTGVSGITWLGGDRYAAVMDNSRSLILCTIAVDPSGQTPRVVAAEIVPLPEHHDYEDLAAWPPPVATAADGAACSRLFLAEEDTPAVRRLLWPEVRLDGGVRLPRVFRTARPNRGVEAVAADPDGRHVWAANEEALAADGSGPTPSSGTVVRIARVPVERPAVAERAFQVGYAVAPPHAFVRLLDQGVYAGVVALVALGDGRLLVLERAGCPGLPPFSNRIEFIDTTGATDVSAVDGGLAERAELIVPKRALWSGTVNANLEGLCLGPPLAEGRLLLGVTDDGGMALPSALVAFRLLGPLAERPAADRQRLPDGR